MHNPVLLKEVINGLNLKGGETVIDATVNRGGHAKAIVKVLGKNGKLFGFDKERKALEEAEANLAGVETEVHLIHGGFENLVSLMKTAAPEVKKIQACLFDLGLSSEELEKSGRGFSFQTDDPLLMTFDDKPGSEDLTAAEIINSWPEEEIRQILTEFGEEPFSRQIAKAIIERRRAGAILTVQPLVAVIEEAVPPFYRKRRLHFATRTFQALRMVVNDDIGALRKGLVAAWQLISPAGRILVITFQSLEAREVKAFFKVKKEDGSGKIITKHALSPQREEILSNPRSRSAKLRIIEKIKN